MARKSFHERYSHILPANHAMNILRAIKSEIKEQKNISTLWIFQTHISEAQDMNPSRSLHYELKIILIVDEEK